MLKFKKALSGILLLLLLAFIFMVITGSCAFAKKKKKLTPEEALEASVKREIQLGNKIGEEISKNIEFIEDPVLTARIRGIFDKLTPWVDRPLPYNIHIVKGKSPNAFCVPGGNIYVTTGLIDFARSDSELAYVIAHELAHADGKHGIIQMERNQKLSLAALAVIIASRGAGAAVMLSQAAAVALGNAYSRDLEQEADLKAADIAEHAGFDLVAGVTMMERLAEEELKLPWFDPTIPLDHPKIADRIEYIADTVENKGYKIVRKNVLKSLRTNIEIADGRITLSIDQKIIARVKHTPEIEKYLKDAERQILEHLQMETQGIDLRVVSSSGKAKKLVIGINVIMQEPVPGNAFTLEEVRKNIYSALVAARGKHPMADYAM